jgi:hypothetical protein
MFVIERVVFSLRTVSSSRNDIRSLIVAAFLLIRINILLATTLVPILFNKNITTAALFLNGVESRFTAHLSCREK